MIKKKVQKTLVIFKRLRDLPALKCKNPYTSQDNIFKVKIQLHIKRDLWTSLVVQRLRIHLPIQGTWIQSLVLEDSTCLRATKPTYTNY